MAGYDGMNGEFVSRLRVMINAARGAGHQVSIGSGYRSPERQAQLFEEAVRKYGSEAAARKWVAPPGKSNHGKGIAADLGFGSDAARDWVHANAARYGLFFPMDWEPWHIEPVGIQEGSDPEAYTTPPAGQVPPTDVANDPFDIGTQFQNFLGAMSLAQMVDAGTVDTPQTTVEGGGGPLSTPEPETAMGDIAQELGTP
jgi:hypothetical protein